MRLFKFLNELDFVKSKDKDWPSKSNSVILFDKGDTYKLKGKTHGLASHAIKHLEEFRPSVVNNIINQLYNYITGQNFYILSKKSKKIIKGRSISKNQIINTLDRVNDKIINNQPLTKEEEHITQFVNKLKDSYEQHIINFIENTTNVDKYTYSYLIKNKPTKISFTAEEKGDKIKLHIDLNNLIYCVEGKKGIKTMFKYKTLNKLLEKVFNKTIVNSDIENYLKEWQ